MKKLLLMLAVLVFVSGVTIAEGFPPISGDCVKDCEFQGGLSVDGNVSVGGAPLSGSNRLMPNSGSVLASPTQRYLTFMDSGTPTETDYLDVNTKTWTFKKYHAVSACKQSRVATKGKVTSVCLKVNDKTALDSTAGGLSSLQFTFWSDKDGRGLTDSDIVGQTADELSALHTVASDASWACVTPSEDVYLNEYGVFPGLRFGTPDGTAASTAHVTYTYDAAQNSPTGDVFGEDDLEFTENQDLDWPGTYGATAETDTGTCLPIKVYTESPVLAGTGASIFGAMSSGETVDNGLGWEDKDGYGVSDTDVDYADYNPDIMPMIIAGDMLGVTSFDFSTSSQSPTQNADRVIDTLIPLNPRWIIVYSRDVDTTTTEITRILSATKTAGINLLVVGAPMQGFAGTKNANAVQLQISKNATADLIASSYPHAIYIDIMGYIGTARTIDDWGTGVTYGAYEAVKFDTGGNDYCETPFTYYADSDGGTSHASIEPKWCCSEGCTVEDSQAGLTWTALTKNPLWDTLDDNTYFDIDNTASAGHFTGQGNYLIAQVMADAIRGYYIGESQSAREHRPIGTGYFRVEATGAAWGEAPTVTDMDATATVDFDNSLDGNSFKPTIAGMYDIQALVATTFADCASGDCPDDGEFLYTKIVKNTSEACNGELVAEEYSHSSADDQAGAVYLDATVILDGNDERVFVCEFYNDVGSNNIVNVDHGYLKAWRRR